MAACGKSMSSQPSTLLTPEEYLEIERRAEWKSEYLQGEMVEMPQVNHRHVLIVTNLMCELSQQLEELPCGVYASNLRLRVAATDFYTYPDVMVICGDPEIEGDQDDIVLNPILIVEVLPESTKAYDRGKKFEQYRTLPSLREYLLVTQDAPRIEQWTRQPVDNWLMAETSGRDASIQLASIDCVLPLTKIYNKVKWPAEKA
jgi:Uma2 family endonuclease